MRASSLCFAFLSLFSCNASARVLLNHVSGPVDDPYGVYSSTSFTLKTDEEAEVVLNSTLNSTGQPKVIHTIWFLPSDNEKGEGGKARKIDHKSFTHCCDRILQLSLRKLRQVYPDHMIMLWGDANWDPHGFVKKYLPKARVTAKKFSFAAEVNAMGLTPKQKDILMRAGRTALAGEMVVPRVDFARYVLLYKYGGSYVDVDNMALVGKAIGNKPNVVLKSPHSGVKEGIGIYCDGRPGCILSNSIMWNFLPRHPVFYRIFTRIANNDFTRTGFFQFGPKYLTVTYSQLLKSTGVPSNRKIAARSMLRGENFQKLNIDDGDAWLCENQAKLLKMRAIEKPICPSSNPFKLDIFKR